MLLHEQECGGLTEKIKEKLAGQGVNHHNSDYQEGVKGGLRVSRNKKSRWNDKGT